MTIRASPAQGRHRSRIAASLVAIGAAAAALPPVAAPASHADEIDTYAYIAAVALVASNRCADILINVAMLDEMRAHFHIVEADEASVKREGNAAAQGLTEASLAAPDVGAWCDAAYRNYGPDGAVLPRLMKR